MFYRNITLRLMFKRTWPSNLPVRFHMVKFKRSLSSICLMVVPTKYISFESEIKYSISCLSIVLRAKRFLQKSWREDQTTTPGCRCSCKDWSSLLNFFLQN